MAKDIDKIIDDFVVPEMEYVKTKHSDAQTVKVPEVVLPKTKAEMYKEAKGRLRQKTAAVSKSYKPPEKDKPQNKRRSRKIADDEIAAAISQPATAAERTVQLSKSVERKGRTHIVEEPRWVGGADELIPFAWRHPLVDVSRPSKLYRAAMREAKDRALMLPVPRE